MSILALEIAGLTYSYPGASRPALLDVDLLIEPGELVVLAGPSGSGKSTLLGAASGLVPHFHGGSFAGSVLVNGVDTRESGPAALAASVGTLFQDPETQVLMGTVRAELSFPLENRGLDSGAVAREVEETALALGIGHLLERTTSTLSGGELQRVALGAALAGNPSLLVLDEPTSQLDPVAGDELMGTLRRLNEDLGTAVLLAEHRLERCLTMADRVLALIEGRKECDSSPAQFLQWALKHAPMLATPGARLLARLGLPARPGVKAARAALRSRGIRASDVVAFSPAYRDKKQPPPRKAAALAEVRAHGREAPALAFDRVWHELRDGPTILKAISLSIAAGERIALMGRNGAGKSTLLRHAASLLKPTRGAVRAAGRVALLLQNPGDYLVHETVRDEASIGALRSVGFSLHPERHPRELSVGERQRLAIAVVLDDVEDDDPPAVVCLDEPTRGLDRQCKDELAALLKSLSAAVLVATHDPEFAAMFADRVILLADGAPIADGPIEDVLTGGRYFATETARIIGALTPESASLKAEVMA